MEIGLSILNGALYKVYDDIIDNHTPISSLTLEIIKVLLVMSTTIIMIKNPDVALFFAVMSIMCYFVNQVDTDFWKALAITPFVISLVNIPYLLQLSPTDLGIRTTITVLAILIIYVEAKLIPEEMSPRKYGTRIGFLGFEAAGAYVAHQYGFEYLVPVFLFFVGYFLSNLIFHFPRVYKEFLGEESKLDASDILPG